MRIGRNRIAHQRDGPALAALSFGLFALVILAHHDPPSLTDFSNWTYQGVLFARRLRGLPDAAHWLKPYPVPNSAATVMIGVLAVFLPWQMAAKLWLCGQLAVCFATLRHLADALAYRGIALWLIAPVSLFLNVNFWYGFHNFELGLCWVLLLISLLLRRLQGNLRPVPKWPLGALLAMTFFTHLLPFVFSLWVLLLFVRQTREYRLLWQMAPSLLLAVW
jgi:hypothetical protein